MAEPQTKASVCASSYVSLSNFNESMFSYPFESDHSFKMDPLVCKPRLTNLDIEPRYWVRSIPYEWGIADRSSRDMDEATISQLVDDMIQTFGVPVGVYHAHEADPDHSVRETELHRKFLMDPLRRGYMSNEHVAVDIEENLEVEYDNPGPEISVQNQVTNSGLLSALNAGGGDGEAATF